MIDAWSNVLSEDKLQEIHDGALDLLANPGMRIETHQLLCALEKKGASVDYGTETVHFPKELVNETIAIAHNEEKERISEANNDVCKISDVLAFSWHTGLPDKDLNIRFSVGGGCPYFYDHSSNSLREANANDFLKIIHLAEGIEKIATVGNPIHYLNDFEGKKVAPKMIAIEGAALVAKNSSKPGATTLMYPEQLDYLLEIGNVVRGDREINERNPLFININDTMPPLKLSRPEGAIIEALAGKKLPVFILPMPMAGISGPIDSLSNSIIGTAEILGVWTSVKALNPEAPVDCSVVSGVMEPRTGSACFSSPETVLQDIIIAELFRKKYGLRCGIGAGFIDAPVPGELAIYERTMKCSLAASCGHFTYPIGILAAGNIFSLEQMMIDMDIAHALNRFYRGIGENTVPNSLSLIREKGIGGLFIDTDDTARNYRRELAIPDVLHRVKNKDPKEIMKNNPVNCAYDKWNNLLENTDPFAIEPEKSAEIDKIVAKAQSHLL